jgi:hypothetical protein
MDGVAAPASPSILNSERIRGEFGNYGIDVLEQTGQVRVSNLYSLDGERKITRTLAVVIYPAEIPPAILAEHEVIVRGGSIGEVFKGNGWRVEKENLYLGEIPVSADYDEIYAMMGGIQPVNLAVHLYELLVCKLESCFSYATIAEVHHPGYLALDELEEIYEPVPSRASSKTSQVRSMLNTVQALLISK